jgi:peptide-methionine (S)-S-oxide reductase
VFALIVFAGYSRESVASAFTVFQPGRIMLTAVLIAFSLAASPLQPAEPTSRTTHRPPLDTVVFAGGCFWGVQAVFQHVNGVVRATSGYAGGKVVNPSYGQVVTGLTGHAESVRVIYDPARVSLETLLEVFFLVAHDPTQRNRQGPDVGTQYRSALYHINDTQRAAANAYIARLNQTGKVRGVVVTEVAPLKAFYVAEAYHQDYATRHPDELYIRLNDTPKIEALRKNYPKLWIEKLAPH